MIIGIGQDITEIKRIKQLLAGKQGARFVARVLTEREQAEYARRGMRQAEFVSGRFAAKEAISKAFGCGIGRLLGLQDIEIIPDAAGKPMATIHPEAMKRLGYTDRAILVHLSISHQSELASAFAIIEQVVKSEE